MDSVRDSVKRSGRTIKTALRKVAPFRTGALRKSIRVTTTKKSIKIRMYRYGNILDKKTTLGTRNPKPNKWVGWMTSTLDVNIKTLSKELGGEYALGIADFLVGKTNTI